MSVANAPAQMWPTRRLSAVIVLIIIGLGLSIFVFVPGDLGDVLADACYAAMCSVLVVFATPRMTLKMVATISFAFCATVELLQLTGLSQTLSQQVPGARLLLGTTFSWRDIIAYALGVAISVGVLAWGRHRVFREGHRKKVSAI